MPLTAGQELGSFEIVRLLGSGGMGEVYLAHDAQLRRPVAVKVLRAEATTDPHRRARFEQEARAASALSHPNICHIYHLGETSDGQRYIAMEYVEGETLDQRLTTIRLTLRETLDIAIQMAAALTAAHAVGIIHRDIKPANVMIRRDRLVKVLDFGLAKLAPATTALAPYGPTQTVAPTEPGSLIGTIDHMSPEQARGQPADARTDIWALGVVLYEMVAGRAPFTGATRSDVLVAILDREPAPLARVDPQVPAELQRIVGKALRKDPERRYQVVKELLLDLEALRDEVVSNEQSRASAEASTSRASQELTRQVSGAKDLASGMRSHRLAVVAAAVMLLAALTGASWWAWQAARSRPARANAESIGRGNYPYTRLTFGPGLQTDPAFSPDGKFIAYASDRAGNFDIWVQALSGGSEPVQVTKSPAHDTEPAWSPDGTTLAFRSERGGGGLFLVPAFGGAERRLTSFGSHPTWSADGAEILFFAGFLPLEDWWSGNYIRLQAVTLDGEPPREILGDFLGGGAWRWVGSHPDGRISALGVDRARQFGFHTVSRTGDRVVTSKRVPLGEDPGAQPSRFQWNAAGTMLYVEAVSQKTRSLWRIAVDRKTLDWISADRLTTPAGRDVAMTLSRDGTRLAFSQQYETSRIWGFPLDTSGEHTRVLVGQGRPLTDDGAFAGSPALSPDGRKLAYQLWHPGADRSDLWVVDLDGGSRELIATNAKAPTWSRDGTKVLYSYIRMDKQPVEAAAAYRELGGTERFLTPWSSAFFFGPGDSTLDGSALLGEFQSPLRLGGPTSIVLWPASNPKAVRPERILMSSPENTQIWNPKFSPNARWIHFTWLQLAEHGAKLGLYVAPAGGAPPDAWVRIAPDHDWPDKPKWSSDGKALFFVSKGSGSYQNLWVTRFDPERGRPVGRPFALTQFDSPTMLISPYIATSDLSISARHAALTMLTVTGSIWMLENVDR